MRESQAEALQPKAEELNFQPSLRAEWRDFIAAFFPGVSETDLVEARRIFYAGVLAFDLVMVQAAHDSFVEGQEGTKLKKFLELAHTIRSELYAEVLTDPSFRLRDCVAGGGIDAGLPTEESVRLS